MGRRAAQEQQTEALSELFRAHAATLTGALSAAGYPDASDAVQEAFAQAVVHWRKVAQYNDPLLWLRRVAINKARKRRRGRERQRALAQRLADQGERPRELREQHDDITNAIARLPEQQRLALSLYYFADLSVADVAAAMEISDGAVKYHLHAARNALAELLEVPNGI